MRHRGLVTRTRHGTTTGKGGPITARRGAIRKAASDAIMMGAVATELMYVLVPLAESSRMTALLRLGPKPTTCSFSAGPNARNAATVWASVPAAGSPSVNIMNAGSVPCNETAVARASTMSVPPDGRSVSMS